MKNIDLSFIFLIIGSIIGAGFSSGKEISVFFSGAGKFSYFIIFLVIIFLYLVIKNLIMLGQKIKSNNIKQLNKILFKKTSKFFNTFILFGLFVFVTAMVAGLNSIGNLIFQNINFPVLTIISILFTLFIVNIGYDAIKKVNYILMPIVLIFLIFLSVYNFIINVNFNIDIFVSNIDIFKYLCLGVCYISYNIVFSSSLIVENSKTFSKKQTKVNSLLITIIIGFLILLINLALLHLKSTEFNSDMPMLIMAFNINNLIGYLFGFVLWFSVLTSLISSLYMLINAFKINKFFSSCLFLSFAFIFSFFGFNYIVNIFYPLQGLIGLIYIFKVFQFNFKQNVFC
ncbi:MAG: hypothetical protein E7359_02115 [Clostridiales bacterium]|nr:hypothetical protein [Clostridiales bacterium]